MAGSKMRRLAAATTALLAGAAGVAVHGLVATGATPSGATWGTFAHIATGDLGSAAARQSVAQAYNAVVLRGPLTSGLLADLRQRRSGIVLYAYEKAAGLSKGDVADLAASHPDWIAHDRSGAVIHPRKIPDTTLADLTNPAYRAWEVQQVAAEVAMGADGAFIDTLGAYFPADFYTGRPVTKGAPVSDQAWRDASVALISEIKAATKKVVIANGFGLSSGSAYTEASTDADQLINAADGVQIEAFTRAGDQPVGQVRKVAQWQQDIAFLSLLGARGKIALAYTKVKVKATAAQLTSLRDYALGSFLSGFAPGPSYFGFDNGSAIPTVASDAPWAVGLGAPTGPGALGNATVTRPFTAGTLTQRYASNPVVG